MSGSPRTSAPTASERLRTLPFEHDVEVAREVIDRYRRLRVGLADASIVLHRHRTTEVLTLDERHVRVLQGPLKCPFRVLPAASRSSSGLARAAFH